jgi:hypothetical protein
MEKVWYHDDEVVCIQPGWDLVARWLAIHKIWVTISQNTNSMSF